MLYDKQNISKKNLNKILNMGDLKFVSLAKKEEYIL